MMDIARISQLADELVGEGAKRSAGYRVFEQGMEAAACYMAASGLYALVAELSPEGSSDRVLSLGRSGDAHQSADWCEQAFAKHQAALLHGQTAEHGFIAHHSRERA